MRGIMETEPVRQHLAREAQARQMNQALAKDFQQALCGPSDAIHQVRADAQ